MCSKFSDDAPPFGRRHLLHRLAQTAAWSAALAVGADALSTPVYAATQDNWRMCQKCHAMFFNGYRHGICAAGGRHAANPASNYLLPYNVAETRTAQGGWRFCAKCDSLFFDGYPTKGACPAGGGHAAAGFIFVLPHDVAAGGYTDRNWRFCTKCFAMFFNEGTAARCAAGGVHTAQGFNFVLRFRGNLEGDVALNPASD